MASIFEKLNLKTQTEIVVLNAPQSFEQEIALLSGVNVRRDLRSRKISFSLAFVTTQSEVNRIAVTVCERADGDAVIWFAYPKGSSKQYACDFNRDTGWAALGAAGFEPVRQVAIDADWSALRFRRAAFVKTMSRDASRAISSVGKSRVTKR
jgi:hypothetical protein